MSIIIDDYEFELLGKVVADYTYVKIQSTCLYLGGGRIFWVYPSNSEMGIWRLAARQSKLFYKGNNERSKNVSDPESYYDYIQQTFIHIDLQIFLNNSVNDLNIITIDEIIPRGVAQGTPTNIHSYIPTFPEDDNGIEGVMVSPRDTKEIFDVIDDISRQIKLKPFIILQQKIECGVLYTTTPRRRTAAEAIREFSVELKRTYKLLEVVHVAKYQKKFINLLNINGSIILFPLQNKNTGEIVNLYAIVGQLTQINRASSEYQANIRRFCSKNIHVMPFFLTTKESSVNNFGVYSHYIPCGAFICKLFDYSCGYIKANGYIQCTREEYMNGSCNPTYSYIGDRYDDIFPFNKWFSQLMDKEQTPRMRSKTKSLSFKKPKQLTRKHSY